MKPKVKFALQYPSGAGGMFLTELVHPTTTDESGKWPTNPGCTRNVIWNEYGGSLSCRQLDGTTEPLEVNDATILVAKQNIENYLHHYDVPITYVIDASDDDSFDYTLELMFIKKWLSPRMSMSEEDRQIIDDAIEEIPHNIVDKYSLAVLQYVKHGRDDWSLERNIYGYRNAWLKDGREKRPAEVWIKNQYRNMVINCEEIEKHSKLVIINYADMFLYGLPTETIFDKYEDEIREYRKRNDEILMMFEKEIVINSTR